MIDHAPKHYGHNVTRDNPEEVPWCHDCKAKLTPEEWREHTRPFSEGEKSGHIQVDYDGNPPPPASFDDSKAWEPPKHRDILDMRAAMHLPGDGPYKSLARSQDEAVLNRFLKTLPSSIAGLVDAVHFETDADQQEAFENLVRQFRSHLFLMRQHSALVRNRILVTRADTAPSRMFPWSDVVATKRTNAPVLGPSDEKEDEEGKSGASAPILYEVDDEDERAP